MLAEAAEAYFDLPGAAGHYPARYMLLVAPVRPEHQATLPAVTHVDGTGRLQTVERDVNPLYWKLLKRFGELSGVPILINTSFNENEPIVNTPAQALDCFLRTKMDALAIGSFLLVKSRDAVKTVPCTEGESAPACV